MFGGAFGQIKYSLGKQMSDVPVLVFFTDSVKGSFGFGKDIESTAYFDERINGAITLTMSTTAELNGHCILSAKADGEVNIIIDPTFNEQIQSAVNIVVDMQPILAMTSDLMVNVQLGKDIQVMVILEDGWQSKVSVVKDLLTKMDISAILSNIIDANILDNETFRLNVNLPPGGVLEIDSDLFNAYLNNTNVLHLQSGDWIFLDRGLVSITIDSGTKGTIEGRILFNERYL